VNLPHITQQDLVQKERALMLARLEKTRAMRDQENNYLNHSQADRQVGLDALRHRLGGLLAQPRPASVQR
jgi:hypothetical protein